MTEIKHQKQRVGVFIDTQNLYHSAKHLYQGKVDFGKVMQEAVGERSLIGAFAYVVTTESGDETAFLEALGKKGIELRSKELQVFAGGSKKGDWDVGMAVDAIRMAPKLDVVILITGDGDFVPLVEYLRYNQGCRIEVVSFGRSSSGRLIEACDVFTDLDKNPKKYLISAGRKRQPRK
jgi:uncharacterized LabA/DUF88 family protein